jgi:hypothetical protein
MAAIPSPSLSSSEPSSSAKPSRSSSWRAQASPFFDAQGQPCVSVQLIDKAEREAKRALVLKAAQPA